MKTCYKLLTCFTVLIFNACQQKTANEGAKQSQSDTNYHVISIKNEETVISEDYPVVLQGIKDVELRPKVEGFIDKILVDEGQLVKKGQLLFTIFAPQYTQEKDAAVAELNKAKAELNNAKMQLNKTKPLVKEGIISKYELEAATYQFENKKSDVDQATAVLNSSQVNLAYLQIRAPFDGIIGLIPYKLGALVNGSSVQPLTTISDVKDVYAYFSMNEKQFIDFIDTNKQVSVSQKLKAIPDVSLVLPNGKEYDYKGKINAVAGQVDHQTGSINFRAIFPNSYGQLRSGNSATIRVYEELKNAILVPQKATFDVQGQRFVYLIDSKGIATIREIKILDKTPSKTHYVVIHGLDVNDKIATENIGNLKEGTKI